MTVIYADTASIDDMLEAASYPDVKGFTTNPSLMRAAGVTDYLMFARAVLTKLSEVAPKHCVSFEVFADEHDEMVRQARVLDALARQYDYEVHVKVPVTFTSGKSTHRVIRELRRDSVRVNITAVFTRTQVIELMHLLSKETVPAIVSVFAGRIADTGIDPKELMGLYGTMLAPVKNVQLLWASAREPLNYWQAVDEGVDIITMPLPMIKKMLQYERYDLERFSLDTVKMFHDDATKSGYTL